MVLADLNNNDDATGPLKRSKSLDEKGRRESVPASLADNTHIDVLRYPPIQDT